MAKASLNFEGFQEFDELLTSMIDDIGQKDARGVLRKAVKNAMEPVLLHAKFHAPNDTGALSASLQLEARKPSRKDKRSKYIDEGDTVISAVTTAPGWKLAKTKFHNRYNKKSGIQQVGIKSDARAVAMEFGTANVAAQPFMRPAMESNATGVLNLLSNELKSELERYKARAARRMAKFTKG